MGHVMREVVMLLYGQSGQASDVRPQITTVYYMTRRNIIHKYLDTSTMHELVILDRPFSLQIPWGGWW